MAIDPFAELLNVLNRKDLREVGGSHNQKGIEFQRHWAIMRMFELEQSGTNDFLFLFEAIQDVAILDSCTTPTSICIYQVKKKERIEWEWLDLTALHKPSSKRSHKALTNIQTSHIGKLYAALLPFKELYSTGRFVSNTGCNLQLADGTSAATSLPVALSALPVEYTKLLSQAFETLHDEGMPTPDLTRIHIERVKLSVDDPGTHVVGIVHKFLETRSPRHAGQARSLVDALLAKIGPLGAKTDSCKSFEDMRKERGFSKSELIDALDKLEKVPDLLEHLRICLEQLSREGMDYFELVSIHSAAVSIFRRQVAGAKSINEDQLIAACDIWLLSHPNMNSVQLRQYFEMAYSDLKCEYPNIKKSEFLAYFALRAIKKCVDQT